MQPHTIILVGPQGSGKGTQIALLEKYFREHDRVRTVETFQSGSLFRAFAKGDSYTSIHIRDTLNTGMLQPLFLSVSLWAREMIAHMNPDAHVLIDGFPRTLDEAHVVHSALLFYKRENAHVVVLDAPEGLVRERMLSRGRDDDTPEAIEERLRWYREETAAILEYFRNNAFYEVVTIDADQDLPSVSAEILKRVGLQP